MNTERDTYNQIEFAREKGLAQGLKQGLEQGRQEAREKELAIAGNLLRMGIPVQVVSQATGLSVEALGELLKK